MPEDATRRLQDAGRHDGRTGVNREVDLSRRHFNPALDDIGGSTHYRWVVKVLVRGVFPPVAERERLDRLVAAVLLVAAELQVWLGSTGYPHRIGAAAIAAAVTASVAVRRRYPLAVGLTVSTVFGLEIAFWGDPQNVAVTVACLCALYAMTVWTTTRQFLVGIASVPAIDVVAAAGPKQSLRTTDGFAIVTPIVMLLVRRVIGDRERRAELAERERDLVAREAVVAERTRIARELHDVVAHSVSVMVVQAQAGPRLLGSPDHAREAFSAIEGAGRGALVELRRLLGVLREADSEVSKGPQPGLDSIASLVDQVREAGLPVDLRIEGVPAELPAGIGLTAFRIVQEALTNTLKHAGSAEAEVVVRYRPDTLELEILDNGAGMPKSTGPGHGLLGMQERIAVYGGTFEAGARNGHGFAVRARLPLAEDAVA